MKSLFFICLSGLSLALSSCVSTVGSIDCAKVSPEQADYIAATMTKELVSYPRPTVVPSGTPIFDAFNDEFRELGWDIRPSDKKALPNSEWQESYIKIHTHRMSREHVLVQLRSPYFDCFQIFHCDKYGQVFETTNPTLNLKKYE